MPEKNELPEGWTETTLKDGIVNSIQSGFACGGYNKAGEGIPHFRPMNISIDGEIDLSVLKYIPKSKIDRESKLIKNGDVIFNNTNSPDLVGKTALYNLNEEIAFSNHMTRLRCNSEIIEPEYLALFLHELWRDGYFKRICNNHVSQSSVSRNVLSEVIIPLPPLAEQQRIVSAIEAIFSRLDAAEARLEKVPEIMKQFRQSVLAAACDGRLTEDWRFDKLKNEDDTSNPSLPEQWKLYQLQELLRDSKSLSYGILKPGVFDPKGIPMVRVLDIGDFQINDTEIFKVSPEIAKKYSRTFLEPGNILLAIMATVGRCIVVPTKFNGYNVNRALAVIKLKNEIDPDYICNVIRSPFFQEKFASEKIGSAQARINLKDLRLFPIPLPPLPEQNEIVRRVDALFALADKIEKQAASAKERTEKLRQSVLAQAFSGRLVETEAEIARREGRSYESAGELLERIRKTS